MVLNRLPVVFTVPSFSSSSGFQSSGNARRDTATTGGFCYLDAERNKLGRDGRWATKFGEGEIGERGSFNFYSRSFQVHLPTKDSVIVMKFAA